MRLGSRRYSFICSVEECGEVATCRGFCDRHYIRVRRYGSPTFRPLPPSLNGDKEYPTVYIDGVRRKEHRVIAERALGKPLSADAVVHHVTENRWDNEGPFKLVLCPNKDYHQLIHHLMREKGISFRTGWPNHPS